MNRLRAIGLVLVASLGVSRGLEAEKPWPASASSCCGDEVNASECVDLALGLDLVGPWVMAPAGQVLLRSQEVPPETVPLLFTEEKTVATASLPRGSVWTVLPEFERGWSPPLVINVPEANEAPSLKISLWPAGEMIGRYVARNPRDAMPARMLVVGEVPFEHRLRNKAIPKIAFYCPIDEEGRWKCAVPALPLDLVLRPEGFVPTYRPGLQIQPGKTFNFNQLELSRAASVVGWVVADGGELVADQARVALGVFSTGAGSSVAANRLKTLTLESTIDRNGMFRFVGVSPGTYEVRVEHPGFSPSVVSPIEVYAEQETALRNDVVLELRLPRFGGRQVKAFFVASGSSGSVVTSMVKEGSAGLS